MTYFLVQKIRMANILPGVISPVNVVILIYLLLAWFSASSFIQFKTVAVLEQGFPGDMTQWRIKGDIDNTLITSEQIAIIPRNNTRTRLGKTYPLVRTNQDRRYISIKSDISSKTEYDRGILENSYNGSEESLFYAWFGDINRESIVVMTMLDLIQADKEIQTYNVLRAPKDAYFVNIELLMRQFHTKHALVGLEVAQVERTLIYKLCLGALIILPLIGLCFALARIRLRISRFAMATVSAVALALVVGVLMPGDALNRVATAIVRFASSTSKLQQYDNCISVQDFLHFLGFLILTLAVLALRKKLLCSTANCLSKIMLFAVFTEIAQRHSIDRSSSMMDILIDCSGVAIGASIWFCLNILLSKQEAA